MDEKYKQNIFYLVVIVSAMEKLPTSSHVSQNLKHKTANMWGFFYGFQEHVILYSTNIGKLKHFCKE